LFQGEKGDLQPKNAQKWAFGGEWSFVVDIAHMFFETDLTK
jgi:hypothetical protein